MPRQQYSRLARTEKTRAVRSTFFYVVLSIGLIVFLLVFGIPILSQITSVVTQFSGKGDQTSVVTGPPPGPPFINTLPEFTKDQKLVVSGSTQGGYTVAIHINDQKKEVIADKDGNFSTSFTLNDGANTISATVKDNQGQESVATRNYTVTYDNEPPKLEIISPSDGNSFYGSQNQQQKIQGQTEPEATVTINDHVAIVRSDGKFDYTVLLSDGDNTFDIKSDDKAGNETETTLTLHFSH